jgi:hypothetical protein
VSLFHQLTWGTLCSIFVWGLAATAATTTLMEGAQLLGLSRMSFPFLFGTFVTANRSRAMIIGFAIYSLGGLAFSFLYALAFQTIGYASWWLGGIFGFAHGLFLVTCFLPLLAHVHPRMASEYDGPSQRRRIEPPGNFGLNYGRQTPLITIAAQTLFGLILGAAFAMTPLAIAGS